MGLEKPCTNPGLTRVPLHSSRRPAAVWWVLYICLMSLASERNFIPGRIWPGLYVAATNDVADAAAQDDLDLGPFVRRLDDADVMLQLRSQLSYPCVLLRRGRKRPNNCAEVRSEDALGHQHLTRIGARHDSLSHTYQTRRSIPPARLKHAVFGFEIRRLLH